MKIILIVFLVLMSACSAENKEAIRCIQNNTCNLNSDSKWEEVDENVYSLKIEDYNFGFAVISFDFNKKIVKNEQYVYGILYETYVYDWINDKGYKYFSSGDVYAVDMKTHMKIVEETTHVDDKLKASLVWDDIKKAVISPFRNTPLYPNELE